MTLIRSKTTRRSAPMTRSRLRSPTSKSTTTTVSPVWASAAPSAAVVVVLPTPPLPDVTTRTLPILTPSFHNSIQRRDHHHIVIEPGLHRPAAIRSVDFLSSPVIAVDREQLGLDLLAEDAGTRIAHM